jgi:hypothetical protein
MASNINTASDIINGTDAPTVAVAPDSVSIMEDMFPVPPQSQPTKKRKNCYGKEKESQSKKQCQFIDYLGLQHHLINSLYYVQPSVLLVQVPFCLYPLFLWEIF